VLASMLASFAIIPLGIIKINPFFIASHDTPQKTLFSLPGKQRSRNRQTIQNGIF